MIFKHWKVLIAVGFCVLFVVALFKNCGGPLPTPNPGNDNNIVEVTPTTITHSVKVQLPHGQHAVSQVDIPHIASTPGIVQTQHVVVTDSGNTLVVTTSNIDWGLRLDPKLVGGYSDDVFFGIGIGFFRVWRFNADALLVTEIHGFPDFRFGAGITYKVFQNTDIGLCFTENAKLEPKIGVYVSLSF